MGVALLIGGCSASSPPPPPPVTTGAFTLDEVTTTTADAMTIAVDRREVPLREMPLAAYLAGLPMTGMASIAIDLRVPIVDGQRDLANAVGTVAFACDGACAIGDDVTPLQPRRGGPLPFGHVGFTSLAAHVTVADGRLVLDRWQAVSPDLELEVALTVALAAPTDASSLGGCLRFRVTDALVRRDPKTAAVLATTGATVDADGRSSIAIAGTVGSPKLLARACDAAAPR